MKDRMDILERIFSSYCVVNRYSAVNVIQSPAPFGLGSWSVFAYGLFPAHSRLSGSICGQASKLSLRPISAGPLHPLPDFHSQPIYLVVFKGSYFI